MANHVPERSEIEARYKWDLTQIYKTVEDWEKALKQVEEQIKAFSAFDGKVAEDPKAAIKANYELFRAFMPVMFYASREKDLDNTDSAAQGRVARASMLGRDLYTAAAFLEPELLAMPTEQLEALAADPEMAEYDAFLRELIIQKPHCLDKEQEKLIAMMGSVGGAPRNAYSMLTNADMKYPEVVDAEGNTHPLTESLFVSYLRSQDRQTRRDAFEKLFSAYEGMGNTIAAMYNGSVQNDIFQARSHNYATSRAAAMEPLEIPEEVYDNLVQVVHEYIPVLTEYLELRKQVMNLDELHMYDLYTPLVSDFKFDLSFDKAMDMVLEGLKPMGEDYIEVLKEARENNWMDVYPTRAKSSGAYSAGLNGLHPFVLLNHDGTLANTFTIAHELGHSMHSYYSCAAQPFAKANYSLFVAEVASTCNEAVMMRHLLTQFTEKKARLYLYNHFLEQFRTTVFRQTMFAEFELEAHRMAEAGQPLIKQTLSEAYYKLNKEYYGGACDVDALIKNEWMRIPHFYRAYYVYVYATGLCAAISLSEKILSGDPQALADYRKFLSAGCSVPPIEALKLAGIDMSKPEPLRKALDVFKATLADFRKAMEEE